MGWLWHRPVVAIAWVVAALLVAFGVRELFTRRRQGVFLSALSFFVALQAGCGSRRSAVEPTAPTPPTAPGAPAEPAPPAAPASAQPALPIPTEFARDDRWARFKRLWKTLDTAPACMELRDPGRTGEARENAARQELAGILGATEQELDRLLLTPSEESAARYTAATEVLVRIAVQRIAHLDCGWMMTRMAVFPGQSGWIRGNLEQRIDALLALRDAGEVSTEAFAAALRRVQDDIYLRAVDMLIERYSAALLVPFDTQDPSILLRALEDAVARGTPGTKRVAREAAERLLEVLRARIRELEQLRPQLDQLVADLEN